MSKCSAVKSSAVSTTETFSSNRWQGQRKGSSIDVFLDFWTPGRPGSAPQLRSGAGEGAAARSGDTPAPGAPIPGGGGDPPRRSGIQASVLFSEPARYWELPFKRRRYRFFHDLPLNPPDRAGSRRPRREAAGVAQAHSAL